LVKEIKQKKKTLVESKSKALQMASTYAQIKDLHTKLLKDSQSYRDLYKLDARGRPLDPLAHLRRFSEDQSLKQRIEQAEKQSAKGDPLGNE